MLTLCPTKKEKRNRSFEKENFNFGKVKLHMKNPMQLISILLVITLFTCAQEEEIQIKTDYPSLQDIKGNVKFVSVKNYEAIPNDTTGKMDFYQSRFGNRDVSFNISGQPLKDVFHHLDGDSSVTTYRYEDDKLVNVISATLLKNYSYNDEKKQVQIDFVNSLGYGNNNDAGEIFITLIETYDDNNNLIRVESKKDDRVKDESKYVFDENNNLIMKSSVKYGVGYMDDDGVFQPSRDTVEYEYDKHNQLTRVLDYKKVKTQHFYDVDGNLTDTWEFLESGRYYVETKFLESFRWKKKGKDIGVMTGLANVNTPEYLKYKGFFPMKYSFKYDFDKKGNWVTRYRSISGEVDIITERKIHYH